MDIHIDLPMVIDWTGWILAMVIAAYAGFVTFGAVVWFRKYNQIWLENYDLRKLATRYSPPAAAKQTNKEV